jgi:hypothetical protein
VIERTIRDGGRTWHAREYELAEYLDLGATRPHTKNRDHWYQRICDGRARDSQLDWRGGGVIRAAELRTWTEGRRYMDRYNLDGAELPTVKSRKRRRCWSGDGDEFDRDRFDAGYLDCWQRRRRVTRDGRGAVRLTIELAADHKKTAEQLIWSGAAACKLADTLEAAGYRVAIDVTASVGELNGKRSTPYNAADVIHAKGAADPLNLDALLMAAACPMFFRFHVLCAMYRRPVKVNDHTGRVGETPEPLRGDIHIAKVVDQYHAERTVREALARINERSEAA